MFALNIISENDEDSENPSSTSPPKTSIYRIIEFDDERNGKYKTSDLYLGVCVIERDSLCVCLLCTHLCKYWLCGYAGQKFVRFAFTWRKRIPFCISFVTNIYKKSIIDAFSCVWNVSHKFHSTWQKYSIGRCTRGLRRKSCEFFDWHRAHTSIYSCSYRSSLIGRW